VSSATGDQESELQSRCPSEVVNRRKRANRACTGDATKKRRCFGHERGAPRGACDGFVMWIPTETDRPARPTMGNHGGTADDELSSRHLGRADRRRRGRSFFAPAHPLGTSGSERFIGTTRARGATLEGSRCWPRRSLHTHRKALAPDGRTEGERREAPSGRARSAIEARATGLVPGARWKMRLVRDGRGLSQRTAPVRGPRIHERAPRAGSADGL
jgi:hypothetical protein